MYFLNEILSGSYEIMFIISDGCSGIYDKL